MASPRHDAASVREVRLEGPTLAIAGAVVVAAVLLGYVVGYRAGRVSGGTAGDETASAPAPGGANEAVDAGEDLTFFDTLGGPGQQAEPRREANAPPNPEAGAAPPPSAGPWFVQVFAGRDRAAAEVVVRGLRGSGHRVRVDAERDGAGALYKVRVGGFATREGADAAADRLRREGQPGAWVTKLSS